MDQLVKVSASGQLIVFRSDASIDIGTGHVMRCLTLAEALRERGDVVFFVCREHDGNLCSLIEQRGFVVHRLPIGSSNAARVDRDPLHSNWLGAHWLEDAEGTVAAIRSFGVRPSWLVVDHYALDARWECQLRSEVDRVMVIDDLADREHDCDLLLDQNLVDRPNERYIDKITEECRLLLGPSYALLQPDYERIRRGLLPREGSVKGIIVYFGGVDRDYLTLKTVDALVAIDRREIKVDIVLSSNSPQFQLVQERISGRTEMRVHTKLRSLAPLIGAADFAVGAGGATNWERLCLGLPALVITVADNQRPIAAELSKRGLVQWLGDANNVLDQDIRDALQIVLEEGLDIAWSTNCLAIVDGRGTKRVITAMAQHGLLPIVIRHVEQRDEELLLEWANDTETRQNAFNPTQISRDEHHRWFQTRLEMQNTCVFYIGETCSGDPCGQVRFENTEGMWEISYVVAPRYRGQGMGRILLEGAMEKLVSERGKVTLVAQVKPENVASRKIFEAIEFSCISAESDRYVYERSL